MAGSLASINIKFSADLQQFSTQMQNAQRDIAKMGDKLTSIGSSLSLGLTAPILGLGTMAVKTAADFETLRTSLLSTFQGNQDAADSAFKQIQSFAAETPYQMEEVLDAFIKLKNLGLDPSEEALTSYGNTASAMGKSLNQMIEAVADASTGEFERLKEFGIKAKSEGENVSFTFQGVTTTVAKNATDIQNYLLGIGNVNFSGAMDLQAQTFKGRMSTLQDSIASFADSIGSIILDFISPLIDGLQDLAEWFRNISPEAQKMIVVVAGILAAIGPLILAVGSFMSLLPMITAGISALGIAFTTMTGPIGLVIAGVGLLIYALVKNWSSVKKGIVDVANYFIDLYNESMLVRGAVQYIILSFKQLYTAGKLVVSLIIDGFKLAGTTIINSFKSIGSLVKAILTGDFKAIPDILKNAFTGQVDNVKSFVKEASADVKAFAVDTSKNINEAIDGTLSRKKIAYVNVDTESLTNEVETSVETGAEEGVVAGIGKGAKKLGDVLKVGTAAYFEKQISDLKELQSKTAESNREWLLYQQRIDEVQIKLNELQKPLTSLKDLNLSLQPLDTEAYLQSWAAAQTITENAVISISAEQYKMQENAKLFNEGIAQVMESTAESFAVGFGEMLGQSIAGGLSIQSVWTLMITALADMAIQVGKLAIGIGISVSGIKKALTSLNPVVAIAAGIALVALGTLAKSALSNIAGGGGAPAFANGGVVPGTSLYGDKILARVNSGELILNQKQQGNLWGMMQSGDQGVNVNIEGGFRLAGSDLELVIERAVNKNSRKR
jgi:hypothetical protein